MVAISEEAVARAGTRPLVARPEFGALLPLGRPDDFPRGPIHGLASSGNLRGFLQTMDCAQARIWIHCHRPCMRRGLPLRNNAFFVRWGRRIKWSAPIGGRAPRVCAIQVCPVQIPGRHDWRVGIRLSRDADGSRAQRMPSLNSTQPAAREASAKEIMGFLKANGQVGPAVPRARNSDVPRRHITAPGSCLGPARATARASFVWKALARAHARARSVNWPSGAMRDIAHAV